MSEQEVATTQVMIGSHRYEGTNCTFCGASYYTCTIDVLRESWDPKANDGCCETCRDGSGHESRMVSCKDPEVERLQKERDQWEESSANWQQLHNNEHGWRKAAEAKLARIEARVRTGLGKLDRLIECIEDECDGETVASICHEHDRTGEGECALVADLKAIRAALADAPAEQT
jgi:hypothetical protein